MKIVILAGGTGSIALQTGLYEMLDKRIDGVETKIIVNAYDNGLSTGAVRQVMGGRILGPSDVRKNQTTRLSLNERQFPKVKEAWLRFLNIRFTVESAAAQEFCIKAVNALEEAIGQTPVATPSRITFVSFAQLLREAVEEYFKSPVARKIDYNDFSLANIIYAGFARANGNSLRAAAGIMAGLMGIEDCVLVNDDTSLFLGAITKSGKRITDEGDIVSWGDTEDPFVDVFFTDADGTSRVPVLCSEAREALLEADLIIASTGTQWSSLIPTYVSKGFKDTIDASKAKVVLVMNRQPDKDSPGQTADDIVKILIPKYFPAGRVNLVIDTTGHAQMTTISPEAFALLQSETRLPLDPSVNHITTLTKHHPIKLASAIGAAYFGDYAKSDQYIFDYDDTLVGRGNSMPTSSKFNKDALLTLKNTASVAICTGNGIKAIALRNEGMVFDPVTFDDLAAPKPLTVYADGGVNKYSYSTLKPQEDSDDGVKTQLVSCIVPEAQFAKKGAHGIDNIIDTLVSNGIPLAKIENRGGVMLAIRPVDPEYRMAIKSLTEHLLKGTGLEVKVCGRTTIEIAFPSNNKIPAIQDILNQNPGQTITYVGDEFHQGNDKPILMIKSPYVRCLRVKDPSETAFFMMTVLKQKFRNDF